MKFSGEELEEQIYNLKNYTEEWVRDIYEPTLEGIEFINSSRSMEIFSKYLDGFIYYEFEKYYLENEDKSDMEICEGFVKKQRSEANESEQVYYYINYSWYKYRVYSYGDNRDNAIIKLLQLAIYEVNMNYFKNLRHRLFFIVGDIHEALKSIDKNDVNKYYDIAFDEFKLELFKKHKNEVKEFIIDYLKGKEVYLS